MKQNKNVKAEIPIKKELKNTIRVMVLIDRKLYEEAHRLRIDMHSLMKIRLAEAVRIVQEQEVK